MYWWDIEEKKSRLPEELWLSLPVVCKVYIYLYLLPLGYHREGYVYTTSAKATSRGRRKKTLKDKWPLSEKTAATSTLYTQKFLLYFLTV